MTDAHYPALRAQVAALTVQHGQPVAVCLQSGGNVAYATFITETPAGPRLLSYDLSSVRPATREYDLPLTFLGSDSAAPEWAHRADTLPIDAGAHLLTFWDSEGDYSPREYREGTFLKRNTATGLTMAYGVGAAL